jgi:site-specific DNA-methyltransferase (adenine-specific)
MNAVQIGNATLYLGDCLDVLKTLPENSVDAIVTDPPYGLSFMGKKWDYDVPGVDVWAECLRVLKPGGHLLAFAGTRTQHRMAVRIEDAGFEIRDMIAWVYGSGFPKSHDVSKAIDKQAGAEREVVGSKITGNAKQRTSATGEFADGNHGGQQSVDVTAPATEAAKQWQGWGTALKPSLEPVTVARKPLIGTVAENVLEHGTGGLNIDGCRVDGAPPSVPQPVFNSPTGRIYGMKTGEGRNGEMSQATGRWPANLIHDGSEEVLAGFPFTTSGAKNPHIIKSKAADCVTSILQGLDGKLRDYTASASSGSAARFFYCAKASKCDRDEGLEAWPEQQSSVGDDRAGGDFNERLGKTPGVRRNVHPTVKPTDLMRYLCRLVTPPGGVVLDPFMGSGSTGKAAALEGFAFIGIEREPEFFEIASRRIHQSSAQQPLFT